MPEEKLKEKITAILLEYPDGFTNKTIERLIWLFYEAQDKKRSSAQNRALHLDCQMIADKLNDAGYEARKTIKVDIPFTTQLVKDFIWRPIQIKMFQKKSTTELLKHSVEIDRIHEVVMRELGEKLGIEYHPFPVKPKEPETPLEYPDDHRDPKKIPF